MQAIVPTISPGDTGAPAANLVEAVLLLVQRGAIKALDSPNQPTTEELAKLAEAARTERAQSVYGKAAQQLVLYLQLQEGLGDSLGGVVESKTAAYLNKSLKSHGDLDGAPGYVVRGTLRDANGKALPGLVIRAIDRDLRRHELLGKESQTDSQGRYEIAYSPTHFGRAEAGGPDLQVQAFDSPAMDRLLVESAILFNAGSDVTVDLVLAPTRDRPSEFETYLAKITPLLRGQAIDGGDLGVIELEPADIDFIAAETGIAKQHLEFLRAAMRMREQLKVEFAQPACYGWFRKGVDTRVEALRARSPSELRQLLLAAVDERIVPATLRTAVDAVLESVGHPTWVAAKALVARVGLPETQARVVSQQLDSVEAIDEVTLRGFVQSGLLVDSHADRLGLAASLHRLTAAHAPTLTLAMGRSFETLGNRPLRKSEDLARLAQGDWLTLLKDSATPIPDGSSIEALAEQFEEACVGAYPTVGMMQRAVRVPSEFSATLASVVSRNPDVDLLSLDLTTDSSDLAGLDFRGLTDEQTKGTKTQMRTMQRVLTVAGHPTPARKLMDAGYHTATRTALATQNELVENVGLAEREAMQVLDRARTASLQAVHAWMAVRDAQVDRQLINGVGMSIQAATAADTQIARWADLFGSADYCDCDHCQSVLGPAAYFVDLMHYAERFILEPSKDVPAPMQLATRRADLWKEKLISCSSTDEVVPTLDIVNALLETWIKKQKPQWTSSQVIHRAIADPAASSPGFGLPIMFPLDRLEILLAHFGLSRDRVVQVLDGTGPTRLHSRLRTWTSELRMIQDERADDATAAPYFEQLYGTNRNLPNGPGRLDQLTAAFSLSDLQVATGLERDVLRLLVLSRFVSSDGSGVPAVAVTLTAPTGAVQNTTESVTNLTRRRLDRLHRLIRLWRKLPWTAQELDYALLRMTPDNAPAMLNNATLQNVVDLLDLKDSTGLEFEEVMSLWNDVPREGFRAKASLFDRRFNAEPFLTRSGKWPDAFPLDLPLPVTATSTAGSDSSAARVLSALRLDENEFADLINLLKAVEVPDPVNPVPLVTLAGTVPTSLRISTNTVSVLYRHALLCRVLKVKPTALMRLVRLTPEIAARATPAHPLETQSVTSVADVLALQRFAAWQRLSGYSDEDLPWLVDAARRPEDESSPADAAIRVIRRIAADRLVVFPASVFTSVGFAEAQSREIMARLAGTAVERTLVQAESAAGATAPSQAPQEVEYRLKSGLTNAELEGFVTAAIDAFEFDVAQTAVIGLARQLSEFDDTAFTQLFLTPAESRDLVAQNLDDGVAASPRRPFVRFTTVPPAAPATRYRFNSKYFGAAQPAPVAAPRNLAGNPINLAGTVVLGFLKQKAAEIAQAQSSAARTVADTLFTAIFLSEQQSRWLVALNPVVVPNAANPALGQRAFLANPAGETVLNVADLEAATQPPVLNDALSAVRREVVTLLQALDPLVAVDRVVAAELGMSAEVVTALKALPPGVIPGVATGIQVVDPAEVFGDQSPPVRLAMLIGQLQRLKRLFKGNRFGVDTVHFILSEWGTAFAGSGGVAIDVERLKAIAAYGKWLRLPEQASSDTPDPKQEALRAALNLVAVATGAAALGDVQWNAPLAKVLDATEAEVRSLKECGQLWHGKWHEQLDRAAKALEITRRLGVGGRTLARICGFDTTTDLVDDLFKAADDIYGAFRAKYPDESMYREKSEAFEDLIRGKRRDALVAYISANAAGLPLQTSSELYAYFLMDVEAGGCARTSRLVAAISSLQLFVHRVMMGLEPARFGLRFDAQEARDQWYWRKNYRVWEANRKVFLFPENFIEPDLRDDKTPLFRALEDELLQRRITTGEAEESYRNYLTGYSEVSGLKIVGAFHDVQTGLDLGLRGDGASDIFVDVLHLVGVTADDPPIHYLRRIGNLKRSLADPKKHPLLFSAWEKLGAQIPVRTVSPIVKACATPALARR